MKIGLLSGFVCGGVLCAWAALCVKADAAPSLMLMRLRGSPTVEDAQWAKTLAALKANRGACDEAWLWTTIGVPPLAWHAEHAQQLARYAEQLRAAGIVPSLGLQATLGHSDRLSALEGTEGKHWRGWTERSGDECVHCNCPRQPAFLDYMREMARLYGAVKFGTIWINDDLRISNHRPAYGAQKDWKGTKSGQPPPVYLGEARPKKANSVGCWCATCLAAFNAETGAHWTRETLDAAMAKDAKLFDRWETFSFASIAEVARVIAEAVHAVSPTTRMGYQICSYRNDSQLAVFRALHEATGLPVGARPGGGAYFDQDPNAQMLKAFGMARQQRRLGNPDWIDVWCPEIESYPRTYASRTPQGILNEGIVSLAYGMNCLSLMIMDPRVEPDEWYAAELLPPIVANRPCLEAYQRHNVGTVPAGIGVPLDLSAQKIYQLALAGVPIVPGVGQVLAESQDEDFAFGAVNTLSSRQVLDLLSRLDERTGHKLPVVVETPTVGLVVPRVQPNGTLRTVLLLNARIDRQKPVTLLLRGVPASKTSATWHAFHEAPVEVPLVRTEQGVRVTVPALAAWNCGWLEL